MHRRCYPPHVLVYDPMGAKRRRRRERRRRHQATTPPSLAARADELREVDQVERLAYSRRQAAEALGVSISTIDRRLVPAVDTVKTPWGQRLIPVSELERFVRNHMERGRPRTSRRPAGRPPSLPDSVIARIRLEYARGRSLGEIARTLSADGIPTAHGGRRWWPSTVRTVLLRRIRQELEAAGLSGPALNGAPPPDRRTPELPSWPGEARPVSEDVDTLWRDAESLRDVDRDHELGSRVDPHSAGP
jgi:hypothetical protein